MQGKNLEEMQGKNLEEMQGKKINKVKRGIGIILLVLAVVLTFIFMPKSDDNNTSNSNNNNTSNSNRNIKGRYILLERVADSTSTTGYSVDQNVLHIAEIKIYDENGRSIIQPDTVATQGSIYEDGSRFLASNLLDNDLNNFAHTQGGTNDFTKHWFKIDLLKDKTIGKIEIFNRKSCCQYRLTGVRVRIINNNGESVFAGPIIADSDINEIDYKISYDIKPQV